MSKTLAASVEYLQGLPQFVDFLDWVYAGRESSISKMRGASPDLVQQLSGEVSAFNEILVSVDYENLRDRRKVNRKE